MRPRLKRVFFRETHLVVHFFTTSDHKFLQARTVGDLYGVEFTQRRSRYEAYEEDYSSGREVLLQRAVEQVRSSFGSDLLFFVEDTSIRIDSLSEQEEVPGLRAKEWFASTTFAELDQVLRSKGNDRTASVRSDIALHLPGLDPILFEGITTGAVADEPPTFDPNPMYPWLTPETFNGWFVPDGADRPLGAMTFEGSLEYDFRFKSLEALITRLEEYTAVLNVGPQAYRRRKRSRDTQQKELFPDAPTLFPVELHGERRVVVVIGFTCSGKTEFGRAAAELRDTVHIEASGVLRSVQIQDDQGDDDAARAMATLHRLGWDAVSREIVDGLLTFEGASTIVITGLRTIEEVAFLRERFPQLEVVFLDVDLRTRYQRQIQRARPDAVETADQFASRDAEQRAFGLLPAIPDLADTIMTNEGTSHHTLKLFRERARALAGGVTSVEGVRKHNRPRQPLRKERVYRCLKALEAEGRPLTAVEISRTTERHEWAIAQRNVNQALREVPELAKRLGGAGREFRYDLTHAGLAYLRQREACEERLTDDAAPA